MAKKATQADMQTIVEKLDDTIPVDVRGVKYRVGQQVAKGVMLNRAGSTAVEIRKVTRVENGKVYLDESKRALMYPDLLAIICME